MRAVSSRIETPAGRFDTLRTVAKGFTTNETNNSGSRQERIIWLSPAAKREVKHEIRIVLKNNQAFRVEGRELVAFAAGGRPDRVAAGRTTRVSNFARCTLKKLLTLRTFASAVNRRCTRA